jgi:hypothetical protein
MSKTSKLIGRSFSHSDLIKVKVTALKPNSRTIVIVKCLDHGPGWDETLKKYKGVKYSGVDHKGLKTSGWSRGDNLEFGKTEEVHINTLK